MQLLDEQLTLSASDLNNFLACPHLTTLDLAHVCGELEAGAPSGAHTPICWALKGNKFRRRYLGVLEGRGRQVAEIPRATARVSLCSMRSLALRTVEISRQLRQPSDAARWKKDLSPQEGIGHYSN